MISVDKEVAQFASWPTRERISALKRIMPRANVEAVLARCGRAGRCCRRLPGWFMVWFVIALGLFCRDSYRQVFRWLQPYRRDSTPALHARHSWGILSRNASDGHRRAGGDHSTDHRVHLR